MRRAKTAMLLLAGAVALTAAITGCVLGIVESACVTFIVAALGCAFVFRLSIGDDAAHPQAAQVKSTHVPPKEDLTTANAMVAAVHQTQASPSSHVLPLEDATPPVAQDDDDHREREESPTSQSLPKEGERQEGHAAFSFDRFRMDVLLADDPIKMLRQVARDIRAREDQHEQNVTAAELFLVRQLEEAGLHSPSLDAKDGHPLFHVVRPHHSGMFYLRMFERSLPYRTYLHVIRIEAALNALLYAHDYYDDLDSVGVEDLYRLAQRMTTSICAQVPDVDTANWSYLAMPWQMPYGPSEHGEWALRHSLSEAIESMQVPYRLEASFRSNIATGDVAIEFGVTPATAFPRSAYVSGLGIVATTSDMRKREASNYAARMGILLANHAFRASERIRHVWVAAISKTSTTRSCLYSACIDRRAFSRLRMQNTARPLAILRSLGATLNDEGGVLVPSEQCFYLEDELFCPTMRHDLWQLSERPLPASAAFSLGTTRVSGLSIYEELPRSIAAEGVLRNLVDPEDAAATERTVRSLLDIAHETSDMSVWSAAERTVNKLVNGTLDLSNPEALRDELVGGDALTRSVNRAQELLARQRPHEALNLLRTTLDPIERSGQYADTPAVACRCFSSFSERVLYNRLNAQDKRTVVLVPDAYLFAHLLVSAILNGLPAEDGGNVETALAHTQRALELAPLNGSVHFGIVACLEHLEDFAGAEEQLKQYLEIAYSPQGIGFAYYRMAYVQWRLGNVDACQACYQRCVRVAPGFLPVVMAECQQLAEEGTHFVRMMDSNEVDRLLEENDIPLAPTNRTAYYLYDSAAASVDAEVFPVARDLMRVIEMLTGDDVMRGIRNSLELEPDA